MTATMRAERLAYEHTRAARQARDAAYTRACDRAEARLTAERRWAEGRYTAREMTWDDVLAHMQRVHTEVTADVDEAMRAYDAKIAAAAAARVQPEYVPVDAATAARLGCRSCTRCGRTVRLMPYGRRDVDAEPMSVDGRVRWLEHTDDRCTPPAVNGG